MKISALLFILLFQTYGFSQHYEQIFGINTDWYLYGCLDDIKLKISNKTIDLNRKNIDTSYVYEESALKVEIKTKKDELDVKMIDVKNQKVYYSLNINYRKKRFNILCFFNYYDGTFDEKNEIKKIHYFLTTKNTTKSKSCSCIFNYENYKHKIYDKCKKLGVDKDDIDTDAIYYKKRINSLLIFKNQNINPSNK